jgi:hypothetical protein
MTYKTSFLGLTKKGWSLDGLDENWVFELVDYICKGHIFILLTLKVLISKPNNNKKASRSCFSKRKNNATF